MGMREVRRVYQPIWTPNGNSPEYDYQRPSAERYEVIKELASKFNRRFSVLDIGSNYGYFDVRLMEDFDCTCVLVDNKFVAPVLKMNNCLDRTVVIQEHLQADVLEALSKSEHFDIVLGLAVLHHFDDPERAFNAIRKLGWWNIFEIPGEKDIGAANPAKHQAISDLFIDSEPMGHFPSHVSDSLRPYYLLENDSYIFEQTLDAGDRGAPVYEGYDVRCDFDENVFIKKSDQGDVEREFVPGMNLYNFQRLGGIWPSEEYIKEEIEKHKNHPDFQPWNFVVGNGITPIDLEDKFA